MKNLFYKLRLLAAASVLLGSLSAALMPNLPLYAQTEGRDCDANAVIRCGALTEAELKQKCRANAGNTQAIFKHFGINNCGDALSGMVEGRVTKDNKVYVGDKLVGTEAMTAGRQNMPGSTPIAGGAAYKRPPSVSFASSSLKAFVKMSKDGRFSYAVIKSCGNPVTAKPEQPKPKPKPKPQPKPEKPKEKPKKPDHEIEKTVRNKGEQAWSELASTKPGGEVEFRVIIRNSGQTVFMKVNVRDMLPAGLTYTDNSLKYKSQLNDDNFFKDGVNIGALKQGERAELTFAARVNDNTEACNDKGLRNIAKEKPDNLDEKEDDAFVKVCKPQVQPAVTTPSPQPQALPDTGPGTISGIFASTAIAGALAHRQIYRRFTS